MIAQKSGAIVNIASIAGLFPYNWAGAYSVVKAGLIMLTKLQAMEWASYGIRANAITPGYIRTPGTKAMYADAEIRGPPQGRADGPRRLGRGHRGAGGVSGERGGALHDGERLGADGGQAVGYFSACREGGFREGGLIRGGELKKRRHHRRSMSAIAPQADIRLDHANVCFVPTCPYGLPIMLAPDKSIRRFLADVPLLR